MELSVEEFNEFKKEISAHIRNIPSQVLNTEIELENGGKKKVTFVAAMKETYQSNYHMITKIDEVRKRLDSGQIKVMLTDEMGESPRDLNLVIKRLFEMKSDESKSGKRNWIDIMGQKAKGIYYIYMIVALFLASLWAVFLFIESVSKGH